MPREAEADKATLREWQAALEQLTGAPTGDEAVALLDLFPADDSSAFGPAWSLLHHIEATPDWAAVRPALDDRSWWVTSMRERDERARGTSA
jgi:hypothetical protein